MLKILNFNKLHSTKKLETILSLRKVKQKTESKQVKKILLNVKKHGDKAVINYEKKFSNFKIKSKIIKFSNEEINKISKGIDKKLKKSIDLAYRRIKQFHSKQKFT